MAHRPTPCGGCIGKRYQSVRCGRCHGTGSDGNTTHTEMCCPPSRRAGCRTCGGTGLKQVTKPRRCQPCHGTGTGSEICRYCGGTGIR